MFTVVGKVRKTGEFNGIAYDNIHLHCTREPQHSGESGTITEVIKVKTDLGSLYDVGDVIEIYYDKFGKVCKIASV